MVDQIKREPTALLEFTVPPPGNTNEPASGLLQVNANTSFARVNIDSSLGSPSRIDYSKSFPTWVSITELAEGFKFVHPVPVKLERDESSHFLAESPTFNLFTLADTYEEALDNIKSLFVDDYKGFLESYPHDLDANAMQTLRIYSALLGLDLP